MAAVAHFPWVLDKGPMDRVRRPLQALVAVLLIIDFIGLGLHLADAVDSPFANDNPAPARARVGGPEAVVPGATVAGARTETQRGVAAKPVGCLAINSGCYPTAGVPATPAPAGTTKPGTSATPAGPPQPVPVAQADVSLPALGAQVSVGVGGGCTSVELTVLALGDCPTPSGEGPVVVKVGGSLLGD